MKELKFRRPWRPYQERVLRAIEEHLRDRKLHVVAAPGAGKTTLGIEIFRMLGKPAVDVYAELRRFGKPVLTTQDAAVRLRVSLSAASRMLGRLAGKGLLRAIRRGLWSMDADIDPLLLPEYLTAPLPAYVSLQTALHRHGMIGQIPRVVYAASLARTRRIGTSIATYSIHRVVPEFFGGYTTDPKTGVKMATPEKALLDVLYLSAARSRLFARLPELELPRRFDVRACRRWIRRIPAPYRRTMVTRRLDALLAARS